MCLKALLANKLYVRKIWQKKCIFFCFFVKRGNGFILNAAGNDVRKFSYVVTNIECETVRRNPTRAVKPNGAYFSCIFQPNSRQTLHAPAFQAKCRNRFDDTFLNFAEKPV